MSDLDVTAEGHGTTVAIRVSGEIDLANAKAFDESLTSAITNEATLVRVDLSPVAFIDSAGLRVLFTLAARLERLQIALELVAPVASPARRVVDFSGLSTMVTVLDSD